MVIEETSNVFSARDVEKQKLLLRVIRRAGPKGEIWFSEFFILDFGTGQLLEIPCVLAGDTGLNKMVADGSIIYVVGCVNNFVSKPKPSKLINTHKKEIYHQGMSYLDLSKGIDEALLKKAPYLSDTRPLPKLPLTSVVTFGRKIYEFCCGYSPSDAFVFDIISKKWEVFPPPPQVGYFDTEKFAKVGFADHENNRILVHFQRMESVFAYYPSDRRWELVLDSFPYCSKNVVFAKGLFLIYLPTHPDVVTAYDVANKRWLNVVRTSTMRDNGWKEYEYDEMVYLGNGVMCLCTSLTVKGEPWTTFVYTAKFKFEVARDHPGDLVVTPLPAQTFSLPMMITSSIKFLPV